MAKKRKKKKKKSQNELRECTYFVDGMHCASCEILLEKRIIKEDGIESVEASLGSDRLNIVYKGEKPSETQLNKLFKDQDYSFSNKKFKKNRDPAISLVNGQLRINREKFKQLFTGILMFALLFGGFLLLENSGLSALISVNSSSSLSTFFVFGLIAGASSCAALVGGVLLSMSKQWNELYIDEDSNFVKAKPFILFNLGRLLSFALLGGILGIIGNSLGLSSITSNTILTPLLIIGVSIVMAVLGMQMLEVKWATNYQIGLPKFVTRFVADEENFRGKLMPAIMGALTFFLPCGFTIVAQGMALTAGNLYTSAMMMFFFALGTLPLLALISFSSVGLNKKPKLSALFNKVAGLLVIFFAIYNFNSQLNVLGVPSLSDLKLPKFSTEAKKVEINSTPTSDGKQLLKTTASARGYEPSVAFVEAGTPIIWEIDDVGASGCTNAIISRDLLGTESVPLKLGVNTVELPALEPGTYKYSCWMGMVNAVIRAI